MERSSRDLSHPKKGKQGSSGEMYSWFTFEYKKVNVLLRFDQPLVSIIRFFWFFFNSKLKSELQF